MNKRTIAMASLMIANIANAQEPTTSKEAIETMTGPAQAGENSICVKVTPYFISSMTPTGGVSSFHSFQINGAATMTSEKGQCKEVNYETHTCETGFVKITSTAPISCHVPIGL